MTTERLHKKGILLRLGLSVVLASVMTVLFCLVYTAGRDWLLQAIESHSLAFLENFDLLGKVQEKFHLDTIPTIWQLQDMFFQIGKYFLFALVFSLLLFFMPVREWKAHYQFYWLPNPVKVKTLIAHCCTRLKVAHKGWLLILMVLAIVQFVLCYTIIYYSWWSGDDYYCTLTTGESFLVKFLRWVWCSNTHVARAGELFFYLFPLTPSRWAHLLLTPTLFVLFPVAVKRLVMPQLSWCSLKGVLFYLSAACLLYLGTRFSTYCCYSPCTNYVYGTIFVMFLLPYYVDGVGKTGSHSWVTIGLFGLCTLVMGMTTESIAVLFSLLLFGQLLWRYVKGLPLPPLYYISLITFWLGAAWLLFTPGASVRGMNSPFAGGSIPYNLYGLPLLTKLSYLPELFEIVWETTYVVVVLYLLTIVGCLLACLKPSVRGQLLRPLMVSLGIALFSLSLAVVYIGGAIPHGSTFTPYSYGLICAFLYLLLSLSDVLKANWLLTAVVVVLCGLCVRLIAPSLSYAIYLKPYELQRNEKIAEQLKSHPDTLYIANPYPADYDSTRTGIPHTVDLSDKNWYFKVKAVVHQ